MFLQDIDIGPVGGAGKKGSDSDSDNEEVSQLENVIKIAHLSTIPSQKKVKIKKKADDDDRKAEGVPSKTRSSQAQKAASRVADTSKSRSGGSKPKKKDGSKKKKGKKSKGKKKKGKKKSVRSLKAGSP